MSGARRIDQVQAGFGDGDAISHASAAMRDAFRAWGVASDIYAPADHVSPSMREQCRPLDECRAGRDDVLIFHYSIGSPATDLFLSSPAKKILVYHNITPAEYFDGFDDRVAAQLREARAGLAGVASHARACWADSEFNARELRDAGASNVRVFPLMFSPAPLDVEPDPAVLVRFAPRLTTVLFVGRIVPNKRVETLIEAYYWYVKLLNPFSRLVIVGSERSCPRYFAMLRMQIGDLDLPNVCLEGFASQRGLPAYYKSADLFVTASEHEGYCLPLLEAMHLGVPVLARAAGGMPEALGGAGALYEGLATAELAALMHRVAGDAPLRSEILASQARRMDDVRKRDVDGELKALLEGLV